MSSWPGRVAVATARQDPPRAVVAEHNAAFAPVVAEKMVARTSTGSVSTVVWVRLRSALLEARWADAALDRSDATATALDAYPDEEVWSTTELDDERASFEARLTPIFRAQPLEAGGPQ